MEGEDSASHFLGALTHLASSWANPWGCLFSLQLLLRAALGRGFATVHAALGRDLAMLSASVYWGLWDCFVFLPESEHPPPLQEGMFKLGGKSYTLADGRVVESAEISVSHAPLRGVYHLCCYAVMELIALLRLKQVSSPNIQKHSCLVLHFCETPSVVHLNRSPSNSPYLWDVLFFPHGLWENSRVEGFWQKLTRSLLSLKSLTSSRVLENPSHFAVYTAVNLFIFFPHPHCQLLVTQIVESTRHFQPTISRYIR